MLSGKAIVAVGVAIVGVVAGVGVYLSIGNRPRPGDVRQIVAVDATTALIRRGVVDADTREFLELYDSAGKTRWRSMMRQPVTTGIGLTPMVSASGAVSVRSTSDGIGQIVVFRFDDGKKMGRQLQHDPGGPVELPTDAAIAVDDRVAYDFYRDGDDQILIIATDLWAGHEMWRARVPGTNAGPVWTRPNRLIVHHAGQVSALDTATGAILATLPSDGRPCVTDREIFTLNDHEVRAASLDGAEPRLVSIRAGFDLRGCGRRGDRIVLVLDEAVVGIDATTLGERWSASLGDYSAAAGAGGNVRIRAPRSVPVSGDLPRFVPVQVGRLDDPGGLAIVMIDAERGAVAWTSAESPRLDGSLVRTGDHFYFIGGDPTVVAELDGATGQLTAAVRIDADPDIQWSNIAERHVWVSRGADLASISLDSGHPWATDIRAEWASELAIPAP